MSIEELIRTELNSAVSTVPVGTPAPLGDIEQRGRRRVLVSRVGLAAAGVAVFVTVAAVSITLGSVGSTSDVVGSTPDMVDSGISSMTGVPEVDGFVVIAGEAFPVDGLVEAFDEAPMYFGSPAPSPSFDASQLGAELPLTFGQASVGDPDVLSGPTVYVGDVGGFSVFVNQRAVDGGPGKCLWMGGTPQVCGDSGAFEFTELVTKPSSRWPLFGAWLGVPKDTSVIVLRIDRSDVGWQRPVGGVAIVPLPEPGVYELVALDDSGAELGTMEVEVEPDRDNRVPAPDGVTTTVP